MRTLSFLLFSLSVLALGSAKAQSADATAAKERIAVCDMITKEEIAKVQGEAVMSMSPSVRTEGSFTVSQCYVSLTTSSNSLVINVTQPAPGTDAKGPREFWNHTFHKDKRGEREETKAAKREKEEKDKVPPTRLEGLGDEAFWTGDAKAGALYVLSRDAFLRLSLGGTSGREDKIKRSRELAELALKRLKQERPRSDANP
jgi:hypothetical protein